MKYIALICAYFTFCTTFSQTVNIEYLVTENTNDAVLATATKYSLVLQNNKSVYFNVTDSVNQFKNKNLAFDLEKIGDLQRVKLSDNHYAFVKNDLYFKDYSKDTLIFNEIIVNKKVIVGEKINLFNWDIVPKSDTIILGFKCQKAITKFRGRTYEAYFSQKLLPYGGPWKFDGLPGLILYVKSLDNYFVLEAVKIDKSKTSENVISNIYEKEKALSWKDFKAKYEAKLREQLKKLKSVSEDGENGKIKITDKVEDLEIPELSF